MEERLRFAVRLLDGEAMTEVCREFGVSRKTGYKIFDRYKHHGLEALMLRRAAARERSNAGDCRDFNEVAAEMLRRAAPRRCCKWLPLLCFNEVAARLLRKHGLPVLLHVHDGPAPRPGLILVELPDLGRLVVGVLSFRIGMMYDASEAVAGSRQRPLQHLMVSIRVPGSRLSPPMQGIIKAWRLAPCQTAVLTHHIGMFASCHFRRLSGELSVR